MVSYLSPYKFSFFFGLVFLFLGSGVFLVFPWAAGALIDVASGTSDLDMDLGDVGVILVIVVLVQSISSYLFPLHLSLKSSLTFLSDLSFFSYIVNRNMCGLLYTQDDHRFFVCESLLNQQNMNCEIDRINKANQHQQSLIQRSSYKKKQTLINHLEEYKCNSYLYKIYTYIVERYTSFSCEPQDHLIQFDRRCLYANRHCFTKTKVLTVHSRLVRDTPRTFTIRL